MIVLQPNSAIALQTSALMFVRRTPVGLLLSALLTTTPTSASAPRALNQTLTQILLALVSEPVKTNLAILLLRVKIQSKE